MAETTAADVTRFWLEEVFPITHDISHAAQGDRDVLVGTISGQLEEHASEEA